jgi:hypothetical protein
LNQKEKGMKSTRKLVALLVVMLAVLAMVPAPAAQAGSAPPRVFSPQAHPYGHTYSEWEIRFLKWLNAIPIPENPWLDPSGQHCAVAQFGPVWYLVDNLGVPHPYIRTCTVPTGKALLVAPSITWCATASGNGDTYAELRSCVAGYWASGTGADVTVDGVQIPNVFTRYLFETPSSAIGIPLTA